MARSIAVHVIALVFLPGLSAQEATVPATPTSPFHPDTVVVSGAGTRVVLIRGPDPDVAALRLSVPVVERPDEAGVGRILRDLGLDRIRTLARPFGVEVDVARTPWGLAYSAAGATEDFETLAWLLREATARPDTSGAAFQRARAALREEAAQREETPLGRIVRDLRALVAPEVARETPGTAGVDALGGDLVVRTWQRTHQASAMTLVASAPLALEVVLAGVHDLGAPPSPELDARDPVPAARPAPVQTLRVWHGEAFAAGPPDTPAATVAALLVSRHLERATGPWETSVQLWTLPGRSVLTVLGAAYPRNAGPMRETVASSLNATADELDDATVRHAAAQVRREILFAARSPSGLVATVGRAYEAGGGPSDVESRLERLATLDAASIRSFLQQLIALGPVRSEVRP